MKYAQESYKKLTRNFKKKQKGAFRARKTLQKFGYSVLAQTRGHIFEHILTTPKIRRKMKFLNSLILPKNLEGENPWVYNIDSVAKYHKLEKGELMEAF